MRKYALLIALTFIVQDAALSQSCVPGRIEFITQSQMDSYQILYPDCIEIEGDIRIQGDNITNLNGLIVLKSVGGLIRIGENAALKNLTGPDNIDAGSISDVLAITGNSLLPSCSALILS